MSPFLGPSGGVQPGIRTPMGRPSAAPHGPWSAFSPNDVNRCYPIPTWVAERIRDYPQTPEGNGLRDPLPVPFTRDEVRQALLDVWQASHQHNNRWCANVPAASVQIAMQVMPILMSRNGGWIDFSGRRYDPHVNTPTSSVRGVNLQCLLYKLPGKPLPPTNNPCRRTPARPWNTYSILDVATTFEPSLSPTTPALPDDRHFGGFVPDPTFAPGERAGRLIGAEIEESAEIEPPGLPVFELVASFGIHE